MKRFIVGLTLLVALAPSIAFAGGGDPQVAISQQPDGRWVVNINTDGPVTVNLNGVTVSRDLPAPAPAEPAPAPGAPAPGQKLFGSCSVIVGAVWSTFHWRWVDNVQRLQPWDNDIAVINEAHKTNWVTCNLEPSPTGAIVEAAGRTFDVPPFERWFHQFPPGDFAVGFAARPK